jgi:hypothetical protein
VRLKILFCVTTVACALLVVDSAYAVTRQSKRQAELNILHAPVALGRLDKRLVNPRTHWFRNNTRAICRGRGSRRGLAWPSFVCTVSVGKSKLVILYLAQRRNGFEIRRLKLVR